MELQHLRSFLEVFKADPVHEVTAARRPESHGSWLDIEKLLQSDGTLYVVTSSAYKRRLAPLTSAEAQAARRALAPETAMRYLELAAQQAGG